MKTVKASFPVLDMSCAACDNAVEKELKKQPGVKHAEVSYASASALVEFDEETIDPQQLKIAVRQLGYDLEITEYNHKKIRETELENFRKLKTKTFASLALSAPVMVIAMGWIHHKAANLTLWVLTSAILLLGKRFFVHAWKMALKKQAGMDTLVAISTGTAYLLSSLITFFPEIAKPYFGIHTYYEPAAMVIAFVLLGKFLEEQSRLKATDYMDELSSMLPDSAIRIVNGREEHTPLQLLRPGDLLLGRTGDRVAVDGMVEDGNAWVDESLLTGESLPVAKEKGHQVFAGALIVDGSFTYRAQSTGAESRFSKILTLVENAKSSKPAVQRIADQISAVFVPVVLTISLMTLLLWLIFGGKEFLLTGISCTLAVLVVACPCALGLATPTAVVNAIGSAARRGILIKNAQSLEIASTVKHVFFDKTGTVTTGKLRIKNINYYHQDKKTFVDQLLVAMEMHSNHPIAGAVLEYFKGLTPEIALDQVRYIPGKGAEAIHKGLKYYLGSSLWMNQILKQSQSKPSTNEQSHFFLFTDTEVLASVTLSDSIRPEIKEAVKKLEELGIGTSIISGDSHDSVTMIAREAGIKNYYSQCSPEEKLIIINDWKKRGITVAMAGDGINDSAALSTADLGIAMGSGAHLALESSQVIVKDDNPKHIAWIFGYSKKVRTIIYQNLFWAFFYNILAIPIAAGALYPSFGILLKPHWAGAAMALSSVSVVANSLRLRNHSPDTKVL
jgi:Cu2+-exporting ATPase